MAALWTRADHYFLPCGFVFYLSILFSSPNLSRHRLDICYTSTHGVALVRIEDAGLKRAARGSACVLEDRHLWRSADKFVLLSFGTLRPAAKRTAIRWMQLGKVQLQLLSASFTVNLSFILTLSSTIHSPSISCKRPLKSLACMISEIRSCWCAGCTCWVHWTVLAEWTQCAPVQQHSFMWQTQYLTWGILALAHIVMFQSSPSHFFYMKLLEVDEAFDNGVHRPLFPVLVILQHTVVGLRHIVDGKASPHSVHTGLCLRAVLRTLIHSCSENTERFFCAYWWLSASSCTLSSCAGFSSNTVWPWLRPTSIPSDILIHPAIWPQQTWAENWRVELGLHLAQCGLGRGPPPYQVVPWSIQPFGHSRCDENCGAGLWRFGEGSLVPI